MSSERPEEIRPDAEGGPSPEGAIEEAVALWIDRLIDGEELDPLEVIAQHPGIGHEVIERLESFVGIGQDSSPRLQRLGDFRLVREIGRGGMGIVYEAHQESMNRRVALKILPVGVAADRTAFLRFMREAQTAGKLRHPAIVGVHSLGIESDTPYYAMEHVDGESLAEIVSRRRKGGRSIRPSVFTPEDKDQAYYIGVAKAFEQVADGLHHAHREGVLHRDIKPSNLMVDAESRLRILDFGLAYFEDLGTLTLTGEIVGTPLYMSPEQARRESVPVDHRTDIYSLGATLYEVLTLSPPFRGKDRHDTLRQVIQNEPPSLRVHDNLIPRALETIVLKCLRKHPESRYSTAQALSQDLARFVKGEPIEARPEGKWVHVARKIRRNRTRIIAALTLLVAIVSVTWLAIARYRSERDRQLALYPGSLRQAVGKLESGSWVLRAASRPLVAPGIDFRVVESDDFRDVAEIGGIGIVEEAIEDLQALTRACPDQPEARFHLARAYKALERPRLALKEVELALTVDPEFLAAEALRKKLAKELSEERETPRTEASDRRGWLDLRREAGHLTRRKKYAEADAALSELIGLFDRSEAPHVGFLTECYLWRAKIRLGLGQHDLAEEDCVRASESSPASLAPELLLGTVYLVAKKPDLARHVFERMKDRSESLDVLPFRIVSMYLSVPHADVAEALEWGRLVPNVALRERLMTYLNLRLTRWDDAVVASRRAVDADQTGLVPRQLLASALVNQVFHRVPGEPVSSADLVEACRAALWIDRQDRRSRFLTRAAWEALRERSGDSGAEAESLLRARKLLMSVADGADLSLPTDSSADYALDDFAKDVNIEDGRPFQWRVIKECCPAEVELGPGGLRVTKVNPSYGHDAWIVTEEAFSGDVTLQLRADLGESAVDGNIHVDLGTASLYFAGVSRKGWCQLGRLDHSELAFPTRVRKIELPSAGDVILELRSRGDEVELRVWPAGSERPATATIKMTDTRYRLGSVAISTKSKSRPAEFRWVRLETASP